MVPPVEMNRDLTTMTFGLVRMGWPNAVAILALAAVPFLSLLLPAAKPPAASQVEIVEPGEQQTAAVTAE